MLVECEGEGLPDSWVGEVGSREVVADEVVAEEGTCMKVRAFAELIDEGGWREAFVHHEVDLSGCVEIERGGGAGGG